jgi:hypothetical protein
MSKVDMVDLRLERTWSLEINLGGEDIYFIDPTPREIDLVFRGLQREVGAMEVMQLYDRQLDNLYRLNGWQPKARIENAGIMTGRRLVRMVHAERGSSPTLIGPMLDEEQWYVQMWVPSHRR